MSLRRIRELLNKLPSSKNLIVDDFPGFTKHKIGLEPENRFIVLLLYSLNPGKINIRQGGGKYLSIKYDVDCTIQTIGKKVSKNAPYTILILKSKEDEIVSYFLELCLILIKRIGNAPQIEDIHMQFEKLELIFSKLSRKSTVDLLGLWGELFLIESSKDPEYFIKSWHKEPSEKIDFNDGNDKIEVKSTTNSRRIHHFEIKQLKSFSNGNTVVASIMTLNIDGGLSISDLVERVRKRVSINMYEMLLDKMFGIVGDRMEEISELKYDYNTALSELKYFAVSQIPKPEKIPAGVWDVKFISNLEDIRPCKLSKLNSILFMKLKQ